MAAQDIRGRFQAACLEFLKRDRDLLLVDVSERALNHKLAECLQNEFKEWNVDVEYNRIEAAQRTEVDRAHDANRLKVLDNFREAAQNARGQSDPGDVDALTSYPDIIIHERRRPNNLLVIEVNRAANINPLAKGFNLAKLQMYQQEELLDYPYAAMVTLELDHAAVEWWDSAQQQTERFDIRP